MKKILFAVAMCSLMCLVGCASKEEKTIKDGLKKIKQMAAEEAKKE